jgi:LEA14-like dessication related protein
MNRILLVLMIGVTIFSCTAVKERLAVKQCKFSLVSVIPHDFTFSNMKVDFKIKSDNPNNVDATLDKLTYTFFVNNTDVFSGTTGKGIKIPANNYTDFVTTILLDYTNIGGALVEAIKLKSASYKIQARVYINTVIGEISYPVEITLQ